ncbi:DUF3572 domain-containing protein [Aestuariispira insulae]|uniref:Uncharacterized protein DUF3572 n=1 Tax=Aestuariispira insulae TaxID=1461337 RepID=A0A3D9HLR2_9PROT|nr:DUF3572 domain-containing protein [Aestuariispira insulae]RED49836.1 uncharacterized protein DUF3572 [Aestuariispira insulae]
MKVTQEQAELLAASALSFIAQDPDRLGRFLAMTGIGPSEIRGRINDPAFMGGLLDFLLAHEPDLLEFVEFAGVEPTFPKMARRSLPGSEHLDS